jgi:hypothetical protein
MGLYFNTSPKIKAVERTKDKLSYNVVHDNRKPKFKVINDLAPETNLQWPDGFLYNDTILYNWKYW